jgi:RimJ/RimL family protein N-acetyltransferase
MNEPQKIVLKTTLFSELELLYQFQRDETARHMAAFMSGDRNDKAGYIKKYTALLQDPSVTQRTIWFGKEIAGSIAKFVMEGDAEITYWIDRRFWGQGIATGALRAFLEIVKTRPICGRTAFDNTGSQKVLERCGFVRIGQDTGYAAERKKEITEYIYELKSAN